MLEISAELLDCLAYCMVEICTAPLLGVAEVFVVVFDHHCLDFPLLLVVSSYADKGKINLTCVRACIHEIIRVVLLCRAFT